MQTLTRAEKSFYGRPRVLKDKKCVTCKGLFRPGTSLTKYCSYDCFNKQRPKKGTIEKCLKCSKDFYVRPGGLGKIKYCSTKCADLAKITANKRTCQVCGTVFYRPRSQEYWRGKGKFCSNACKAKGKIATVGSVDAVWALLVKARGGNKCEYCGKKEGLNAHHIFSRSNRVLRWKVENGVSLCVSHHVFGNFSAHKAPIEFLEWLRGLRGDDWYNHLRELARSSVKIDKIDFRSIKDNLTNELNREKTRFDPTV